jgi:hypothetical protein
MQNHTIYTKINQKKRNLFKKKIINNKYSIIFLIILFLNVCLMGFAIQDFSISYTESIYFFDNHHTTLHFISNFFTNIFGANDFNLRFGFLLLYTLSVMLFFAISKQYLDKQKDALICTFIFMLTPGITSAGIIVSIAIVIVFGVLLFLFLYHTNKPISYILLCVLGFISPIFSLLFVSLFAYCLKSKNVILGFLTLSLAVFFLPNNAFIALSFPQGYFLDIIGKYISVFSPILFLYIMYCFFATFFKNNKNIVWYIAFTPFVFSLILSLRQDIDISYFAPFVVLAILISFKEFMHSFRVKLALHRKYHFGLGVFIFSFLILHFILLNSSKSIYPYIQNKQKNFAYDYHIAKDLAKKLKNIQKQKSILFKDIYMQDIKMRQRLKFYDVNLASIKSKLNTKKIKYTLQQIKPNKINTQINIIKISYSNELVAVFELIKY